MKSVAVRRPASAAIVPALRTLLLATPLLFGVPILIGLVQSVVGAAQHAHPFFADISGTPTDARAVALGTPLYQNPADGYTPSVYTPLMSLLAAGLDHLVMWDGWSLVLTILADASLVLLGAWLAWSGSESDASPAERTAARIGAIGAGAVALWLMTFVPFNFAFSPRPDQLSWAFSLLGLAALPAAGAGSRRAQLTSLVLLSAGFWTKQTSAPAFAVAAIWIVIAAARGRARPSTAVGFVVALAVMNAALFALLDLLTGGWAWNFIVQLPGRRSELTTTLHSIGDLATSVGVPLAVAAVAWAAAAYARRRGAGWPRGTVEIATVLALFVVVDAPFAVWFREAQGAVHNMYAGIGWACGLLFAAAWGLARTRLPSLALVAGLAIGLFGVSESARVKLAIRDAVGAHVPAKSLRAWPGFEPPGLVRYADAHRVYHPAYPGIGAHREQDLYPGSDNVEALLWSGVQPGHLVRALLQRRFDLVYLFENDGYRGDSDGYGRWEENYFWKLNELIKAKYRPATGALRRLRLAGLVFLPVAPFYSPYVFERRPGPDPAPWMSRCFGPLHVRGATFRIAHGGGFWCRTRPGSDTLRLVATPSLVSEIRDDDFQAGPHTALRVGVRRTGTINVSLSDWQVASTIRPGHPRLIRLPRDARGGLDVLADGKSGLTLRLVDPART